MLFSEFLTGPEFGRVDVLQRIRDVNQRIVFAKNHPFANRRESIIQTAKIDCNDLTNFLVSLIMGLIWLEKFYLISSHLILPIINQKICRQEKTCRCMNLKNSSKYQKENIWQHMTTFPTYKTFSFTV